MNLWFEGTFALMVAAVGVVLGYWFSRLRKPYWTFGYFIPLTLVLIYAVAVHFPAMFFTPPVSWMMMGRKKFAVLGFVATMVLTTPLSRVPKKRDRIVISILMAVMVFAVSVWPFIVPAFERNRSPDSRRTLTRMGFAFKPPISPADRRRRSRPCANLDCPVKREKSGFFPERVPSLERRRTCWPKP